MPEITNRFGRRGGRGLRPWLLLPKVLAVAIYLGALAAALLVWHSGVQSLPPADPRRLWTIELVSRLIRYLAVPALFAAMAFGAALLLQHPREFLRMRWLLVKLAGIAILVPGGHFYVSSRMALARTGGDSAALQLEVGLGVVLLMSVGIMILGRLKPQLGQNWARTYSAINT